MADYKGQTRTPYTNAMRASLKAQEESLAATAGVSITEQDEQPEQAKKRGRPAKSKEV
jgi:hypothetical protein